MPNKPNDFSASVAHFKALADEELARLRASTRFRSFLSDAAIDAFSSIEQSAYAGSTPPSRKQARI